MKRYEALSSASSSVIKRVIQARYQAGRWERYQGVIKFVMKLTLDNGLITRLITA
jgi:hypothetical protein